jgi:uncharacterized protein YndB with AHSA1/START domain
MASGPAGREATETVHIAAAPERVWAVVANVRGHAALAGSGEVLAIRMDGPVVAGATFEGDIRVGEVGSFVSRNVVEEVSEPHRLAWVSYPPLDEDETEDHQIEVHWSFDLVPAEGGTELRHGFRVPPPVLGADELAAFLERTDRLATVREGMRRTLENAKSAAEAT